MLVTELKWNQTANIVLYHTVAGQYMLYLVGDKVKEMYTFVRKKRQLAETLAVVTGQQ